VSRGGRRAAAAGVRHGAARESSSSRSRPNRVFLPRRKPRFRREEFDPKGYGSGPQPFEAAKVDWHPHHGRAFGEGMVTVPELR